MGVFLLAAVIILEILFTGWKLATKQKHTKATFILRLGEMSLLFLLLLTGAAQGVGRYGCLAGLLMLQAVRGGLAVWKGKEKPFRRGRQAAALAGSCLLYAAALLPAILFPQYAPPAVTGSCQVRTAEYTWVDESRTETYTDTGEYRKLTVKFWYPAEEGSYPLVVFSHGAFGIIDSNFSTCEELASNGYVAASIGHPYQAMFVRDTGGSVTLVDPEFMRQVYEDNGASDPEAEERNYREAREWTALRAADENFVLDTIIEKAQKGEEEVFRRIGAGKIGLFGHSLGGVSSVQLGRERDDIGAVIDLEGTMFGEYTGFADGEAGFRQEPYPVPLLDINSEQVYNEAKQLEQLSGQEYVNFYVGERAAVFHEAVFRDAGHLNFTDLPLVSPPLAKLLGTGSVDARSCIEDVNAAVLGFFDYYLKGKGTLVQKQIYG